MRKHYGFRMEINEQEEFQKLAELIGLKWNTQSELWLGLLRHLKHLCSETANPSGLEGKLDLQIYTDNAKSYLNGLITDVQSKVSTFDTYISDLRSKIPQVNSQITAFNTDLANANAEMDKTSTDIKDLYSRIQVQIDKINIITNKISDLNNIISNAKALKTAYRFQKC